LLKRKESRKAVKEELEVCETLFKTNGTRYKINSNLKMALKALERNEISQIPYRNRNKNSSDRPQMDYTPLLLQ
jgi:hypothetical protein